MRIKKREIRLLPYLSFFVSDAENKMRMLLGRAERNRSFLCAYHKGCCDTKSDSKEKVGEFKVAVCSVYFEYAFINRAYRKCCDSALPWETGICRERFLKTMQKEAWHSESQERN